MNIAGGPSEASFPKNVGLLFLNGEPHRFFPATRIGVVWFPEGAGGDRFVEKEFRGPISTILREVIDYIDRNDLKETIVKHPDRPQAERFRNLPLPAVEEALVNAIYHRSYEVREPVEVRITPQELTILSFPGADRSIRMEELRTVQAISRRYCNRRVGEFLKELDLAEGRPTGIPKTLRAMREKIARRLRPLRVTRIAPGSWSVFRYMNGRARNNPDRKPNKIPNRFPAMSSN